MRFPRMDSKASRALRMLVLLTKRRGRLFKGMLFLTACILISLNWTGVMHFYEPWKYRQKPRTVAGIDFAHTVTERPYIVPAKGKFDVILSAYMNSGSRFTGRLMGFRPDSFYFYEPLWKFSVWDFFKAPNLTCSSTHGVCREMNTTRLNSYRPYEDALEEQFVPNGSVYRQPEDVLMRALSYIYRCNLQPLRNLVEKGVHDLDKYSGPSWTSFRKCSLSFRAKSECLRELESSCNTVKHRVAKVIRMTLGSYRPLLESNQNLKLFHLFRDPRAIINSRLQSRYFPVPKNRTNSSLEINLCRKMRWDFEEGLYLMSLFPGRVKFLFYENLMDQLHNVTNDIYSSLGMVYNATAVDGLNVIVTNLAIPDHPDILRDHERLVNNAYWWRTFMTWRSIRRVDTHCGDMYERLGYRLFGSEQDVRNLSIPSFTQNPEFTIKRDNG